MTAKEQLIRLLKIQEVVTKMRTAVAIVEAAPGKIEEIESHFRERNAEFVALKNRHDELELDRNYRTNELTVLEESKAKYTEDLMQVQNQKEYAAMLKEIDGVKAQIAEHEEAVLRDMEEIEKLKGELATHEEHINKEREAVEVDSKAVHEAEAAARATIERLDATRAELEADLPAPMLSSVKRLEARRQGVFLSEAVDGTCQCCFVRMRPQVFQEMRAAAAVHNCGNCKRYLYYAPGIVEAPAVDPAAAGLPADVAETTNGGTV